MLFIHQVMAVVKADQKWLSPEIPKIVHIYTEDLESKYLLFKESSPRLIKLLEFHNDWIFGGFI